MKKINLLLISFIFINISVWAQKKEKPNVILILADDMALADMASMNGGLNKTPVLDNLRKEGVWFQYGYTGSPVCAPARASLLTGKYPHRTGVVSLSMKKEPELTSLKTSEVTLADAFQQNGYKTALVGKWHLGSQAPYHPLKRGFDESYNFLGFNLKTYYNFTLNENGKNKKYTGEYLDDVLTNHAINFIENNKSRPFFMHLAYSAPHRPLGGPKKLVEAYKEKYNEKVANVYAMIEAMDSGIGRLIEKLEELQLRENTLIIFASDNGIDPAKAIGPRFNLNMRGHKYRVFEGGIHVPFIFNWPGHIQPAENDEVVSFTDIFPTLVEMCDLEISKEMVNGFDGASLYNSLQGKANKTLPQTRFWQWNRHEPRYESNGAVQQGKWKMVRLKNKAPFLFNLEEDKSESNNLSSQYPEKVKTMEKLLDEWCSEVEEERLQNSDF